MSRRRGLGQAEYRQHRVRGEARTIPVFGTDKGPDDDRNTLFRCWNCDMINSIEKDPLGDYTGTTRGNLNKVVIDQPTMPDSADPLSFKLAPTTQGTDIVLMEIDAAGDQKVVKTLVVVYSVGCRLCGTRNWKK